MRLTGGLAAVVGIGLLGGWLRMERPLIRLSSPVPGAISLAQAPSALTRVPAARQRAAPVAGGSETVLFTSDHSVLFSYLDSPQFLAWVTSDPAAAATLVRRFENKYPADDGEPSSPFARETLSRVGILRALEALKGNQARPFYLAVLQNPGELWIVKRQALRAFHTNRNGFRSDEERSQVLAAIDPRAIATAELSDDALMQRALHEN